MCERDEFIPNYERLFHVDTRLAFRATTSSIHLINRAPHSNPLLRNNLVSAGSEFGIGYPRHTALLSGNPLSRMLSQDTLDLCLELSFHFGFSVLKTASTYRERQLLANSVPDIIFQPEAANFRDASDCL